MPRGPKSEKRPADARQATGLIYVSRFHETWSLLPNLGTRALLS